MTTLLLTGDDVRRLLPMDRCIDLMAEALATLGRGDGENPLRRALHLPGQPGLLGLMPGTLRDPAVFGLKAVSVFPQNHGTDHDSHQGVVLLFETEHGRPTAILDASSITEIRTAAVSGLATRLLAPEGAGDLAILGSGVQARSHLAAMLAVRRLRRVRVWSPNQQHREDFATCQSALHGLAVEAVGSAEEAVRGADLLCTVTSSREPVVAAEWLTPGLHINAAGSSIATARELDSATVAGARLFIDRRESTLHEAGDFLIPKSEGLVDDDHIVAELGELLLGQAEGRRSAEETTLFKSLGLAAEDLAAAYYVAAQAGQRNLGQTIDLAGAG